MKKRRNISLKDVITWVMLSITLLAILAGVMFFAVFTNGFKSDFKEFYLTVESGGMKKTVMQTRSDLEVYIGSEYKINTKYTFEFLDKEYVRGYDIAVVPNNPTEDKFVYMVDGVVTDYMSEKDLSSCLNIERDETSFVFTVKTDLPELIRGLHPDSSVVGVPNVSDTGAAFITLVVYSEDKTKYMALDLVLKNPIVELNKTQIVF